MNQAQPRRHGTIGATPRRPVAALKPKVWSHQDELVAMRGKRVVIGFRDGQAETVTLLEADQFAIKVELDPQSILIVWKHDLCSIALEPVPAQ